MKDLVVEILEIVAPVSVALVVFAEAVAIEPNLVARFFKERPALILRSFVAALVLVPAAALALILVLEPAPGVAVGLAILVACPPAPLMIKAATNIGGGSAAFMATLHLCFAALALVTVPAVLYVLSGVLGFEADVHLGPMAWILGRTILLPIGLGLAVHAGSPSFAAKSGPLAAKAGAIGVLVVLVVVLAALYPALLSLDGWSYLVIATVAATALAIGHLLGPQDPREKTILAVECAARHPALALTIAAANFTLEKALPVLLPCVIAFVAVAMVYLLSRGRSLTAAST